MGTKSDPKITIPKAKEDRRALSISRLFLLLVLLLPAPGIKNSCTTTH
jgi:hypothetical protein